MANVQGFWIVLGKIIQWLVAHTVERNREKGDTIERIIGA